MMGKHEAGKAGDPSHDWFFERVADWSQEKTLAQIATGRAGTVIIILSLLLAILYLGTVLL